MPSVDRLDCISPDDLAARLSTPPVLSSDQTGWERGTVRLWREVEPESYPPLDQHCLTLHLGNARRIVRSGEGGVALAEVRPGALSITPWGAAYDWSTTGPVDYAELYFSPAILHQVSDEVLDKDHRGHSLQDPLGVVDPLAEALFTTMLAELGSMHGGSKLFLDTLFNALVLRLVRLFANAGLSASPRRLALAPERTRRVIDYIEANLATDVGVTELAEIAGVSAFHFTRAFKNATGSTPYAYLTSRRVAVAKRALADGKLNIGAVAALCGFRTSGQFARMFKQMTGMTPTRFRRGS
ncbi:AraC family transcriptional regulator [Polymorphobacter sp. PAMC 29334]|uniref:helix-turn-helix domain-containing protein n=1 Tax=Polymorphobacter sp. PAMC 29334 TaxID=2862331 RepID=UPI001C66F8F1|nr:AraC family transcriptional regulator [Polymorphobacter sp. PAMC 29334]QYE35647.1 AraC family transcriptional regulator [Polymorphobacter sp. PAMC 29334]